MDRERSDEWVARVVAWHNRHPLARRITPQHVQAMGWVSLPFGATVGARTAAADAPRGRGWRAAYTERFLPPFSPRRVARWVLRYGQESAPELAGSPVREIPLDRRVQAVDAEPVTLWVPTVAIVDGRAQSRVLLATTAAPAVLGRRLWSRPRLAASAAMLLLVLVLPATLGLMPMPARQQAPLAQAVPTEPAAVVAVAVATEPAAALQPGNTEPEQSAPAPVVTPPDVPVSSGSVSLPQKGFALDDEARATAREAARAARAARAALEATKASVAYAVAAPRVRSHAESELVRAALQAAVRRAAPEPGCRVEALPAGDDWRVVCWPFVHRRDAERLREQLVARGHRLEVIDF